MTQVQEQLSGTLEFKMPVAKTPTKEEIYDQIGLCNQKIVYLEHNIPQLRDKISGLMEDVEDERHIRTIIHEEETELKQIKATVKDHRLMLIGMIEMEISIIDKKFTEPNLYNVQILDQQKRHATDELRTLLKLVV
jgi:hypothetical protein